MSIQIGPHIECSACKVPKKATNHWFRLWPYQGDSQRLGPVITIKELLPEEIASEQDLIPGEEHACGNGCLGKLVQRMAAREFGRPETATPAAMEQNEIRSL